MKEKKKSMNNVRSYRPYCVSLRINNYVKRKGKKTTHEKTNLELCVICAYIEVLLTLDHKIEL